MEPVSLFLPKRRSPQFQEIEGPDISVEDILHDLVSIPSGSHDIKGVSRVQFFVQRHLEELGFDVSLISHHRGQFGPLVHASRMVPGKPIVTLVCHADTVFDEVKEGCSLRREGERIFGPGVADDKGGIAVALAGLQMFLKKNNPQVSLQFVCSPNEEVGSPGFLTLMNEIGLTSDFVLGFEPSTKNGDIITERSGNRWYKIAVEGISAHAGRANGNELNAAHELFLKVQSLLALKEECDDLKVNVAQISGGQERYNIVCGQAFAKIDVRYKKRTTGYVFHERLVETCAKSFLTSNENKKTRGQWLIEDDCPPLEKSERSNKWIDLYLSMIGEIEGRKVAEKCVGGASDANHFSHEGNIVIDGLGPIGDGLHTEYESIETRSLYTRSQALCEFLKGVSR